MTEVIYVDFLSKKVVKRLNIDDSSKESEKELEQSDFDKLSFFSQIIALGRVSVSCDATKSCVQLPERLRKPDLTVTFSHGFKTDDLLYNDDGISQTLDFQGEGFKVLVPFEAIKAIALTSGGQGRTWKEDNFPKEMTFHTSVESGAPSPEPDKRA